jgi:hypothetical protein
MTTWRQAPFCLFTDQELAGIGLSEREAREQGVRYRLAKIPRARARTGLWEPRVGNDPRPPGQTRSTPLERDTITLRAGGRMSRMKVRLRRPRGQPEPGASG